MAAAGAEVLAAKMRERIRDGRLAPGSTLNQVSLAEEFGVSRIPVREALRSLQGEGLVVLDAGKQARVVEHTRTDITDLYDLRLRLEPVLAEQIIDTTAPADLRRLRDLARRMAQQSEPDGWSALNRRFHKAMYETINRNHTLRIVRQLIDLVEPYSHHYLHQLSGLDRASGEHHAMLDAIEQGDADQLEVLIREHLAAARDALLAELVTANDSE